MSYAPATPPRDPHAVTLGGRLFSQGFVLVFCVVLPALLTAIAPVSWLTLRREGDKVHARGQVCMFFIFPFRTYELASVDHVGKSIDPGKKIRRLPSEPVNQPTRYEEDEGFLILSSGDESFTLSTSPYSLDRVVGEVNAFLSDQQATSTTLFLPANWKFSVLFGGACSLATLLYVCGITLWTFKCVWRFVVPRRTAT